MEKVRVLIGSPVHQKPQILKEFLVSLKSLQRKDIEIDYMFIDDNERPESSDLLKDFKQSLENVTIINSDRNETYICSDTTHHWSEDLIWKVAGFKNKIIKEAIKNKYDYLFLIDSDILLYPQTVEHLVNTKKDIVCEIHWSVWYPGWPELPNVWLYDSYNMVPKRRDESLTKKEEDRRHLEFLSMLRKPGVYEIGGLCACTLISKKALRKGVNFNLIKNLSFWGEDRHFCTRACALGLELYVDTNYPGYHIYRESDLDGVEEYKEKTGIKCTENN